eukprot:TRINITY_DN3461_c0_g1_i1.p1 TRINITY_DN3461_c0_g1~~TRINITY_DN3461_c0_g1_i1.p1  ORF type:complete len:191 (-),score=30.44 TRINITY_DN3461_c0_g1_i1:137-709(-)
MNFALVVILVLGCVTPSLQQQAPSLPAAYSASFWYLPEYIYQTIYVVKGMQRLDTLYYNNGTVLQQINLGHGSTYNIFNNAHRNETSCTVTTSKPPTPIFSPEGLKFQGYVDYNYQNASNWYLVSNFDFEYYFQYYQSVESQAPLFYQAGFVTGPVEVEYDFVWFLDTKPTYELFYISPALKQLCEQNGV